METDSPAASDTGRGGTELIVQAAARRGVRACNLRLPQVHDTRKFGLISPLIEVARNTGVVAYVSDVARLYRLALEKAGPGVALHAVGEEGVSQKMIAETLAAGMNLPLRSLTAAEAADHFGWMAMFAGLDNPTSSAITQETMGWTPTGQDLITDLRAHFAS